MTSILKKKLNKKGFTLAELLVVVAIISILVAISIPIFSAQLATAQKRTNLANCRAAKSEAIADYLANGYTAAKHYTYTVSTGKVGTAMDAAVPGADSDSDGTYDTIGVSITANGDSVTTDPAMSTFES